MAAVRRLGATASATRQLLAACHAPSAAAITASSSSASSSFTSPSSSSSRRAFTSSSRTSALGTAAGGSQVLVEPLPAGTSGYGSKYVPPTPHVNSRVREKALKLEFRRRIRARAAWKVEREETVKQAKAAPPPSKAGASTARPSGQTASTGPEAKEKRKRLTPLKPPSPDSLCENRRQRRMLKKERKHETVRVEKHLTLAAQLGVRSSDIKPLVRTDEQFKTFKPITHSIRWLRYPINDHLHKGDPIRSLTAAKRSTGGRNNLGHVTVRGRGGGHRRRLRMVDFFRWEQGKQDVLRIEYDPGRSGHIALLRHQQTEALSYILAPDGLRSGDVVQSFRTSDIGKQNDQGSSGAAAIDIGVFRSESILPGNCLPLRLIPVGTEIHSVSLDPSGSAKLIRSAGSSGRITAFVNRRASVGTAPGTGGSPTNVVDEDTAEAAEARAASIDERARAAYDDQAAANTAFPVTSHAQVRMQSGEVRYLHVNCVATIGRVSNINHEHRRLAKAGRNRWLGRRPKVRGVAMNTCDHPHGGGRGKSKSNKHPRSIYGRLLKGQRTRRPGTKGGNTMVVKQRPRQLGSRKLRVRK